MTCSCYRVDNSGNLPIMQCVFHEGLVAGIPEALVLVDDFGADRPHAVYVLSIDGNRTIVVQHGKVVADSQI